MSIEVRLKLRTARAKCSEYFQSERRVLDAIREFLAPRGIRSFTEHDGFRTDLKVDVHELEAYIEQQTGFEITIKRSWENHS